MGVPSLARLILKKYKNTHFWKTNFKVDYFLIDYNCMMYSAYHDFLKLKDLDKLSKVQFENKLIDYMIEYSINIVCNIVKPLKGLYIAMDGPPPRAKIQVQRFRRYSKVKESEYLEALKKKHGVQSSVSWDTSNLTPGTKFMAKFSNKMIKSIKNNMFCKHNDLEVIFSDTSVPGEGEHKIMPYIKSLKTTKTENICIYSNDADLIVLSFPLTDKNIFILRGVGTDYENELYPIQEYYYLDISKYRIALIDELSLNHLDKDKVVYDYIFLTFFGGNDFVKPIPYLRVKESDRGKGLNILLGSYVELIEKHKQHLVAIDKDGKVYINTFMVTQLIEKIAMSEDYHMKGIQRYRMRPSSQQNNHISGSYEKEKADFEHKPFSSIENPFYEKYKNDFKQIDYLKPHRNWKEQYYHFFFGISEANMKEYNSYREIICRNYLESLKFSLEYYVTGVPSWTWYYRFRVAPLATDLNHTMKHIKDINSEFKFNLDKPFTPLEQLMFVIPPQKSNILPKKLGSLMTEDTSSIIEYYPISFDYDAVAGEKMIYSDPLLPDIDKDKVMDVIKPIIKNLSASDKKLNNVENDCMIFKCSKNI